MSNRQAGGETLQASGAPLHRHPKTLEVLSHFGIRDRGADHHAGTQWSQPHCGAPGQLIRKLGDHQRTRRSARELEDEPGGALERALLQSRIDASLEAL